MRPCGTEVCGDDTARRRWSGWIAALVALASVLGTFGCGPDPRYSTPPDPGRTGPRVGDIDVPVQAKPQAPVPAPRPAVDSALAEQLFPHGNGDTWEMVRTSGSQTDKVLVSVSGSTTVDQVSSFSVETQVNGELVQAEGYIADSSGIYRISVGKDGSGQIEPRMPLLRLPVKAGDTWLWKGKLVGGGDTVSGSAQCSISAPEKVKVPAGEFDAYRLEQTLKLNGAGGPQTVKNTEWLAPKVGLVKQVTDDGVQKSGAELTKYAILERW